MKTTKKNELMKTSNGQITQSNGQTAKSVLWQINKN